MSTKVYRGVTVHYLDEQKQEEDAGTMYTLTERTYLNADRTKVVPEDSPDAFFLLGVEGANVPDDEARALGLGVAPEPEKPAPRASSRTASASTPEPTATNEAPQQSPEPTNPANPAPVDVNANSEEDEDAAAKAAGPAPENKAVGAADAENKGA